MNEKNILYFLFKIIWQRNLLFFLFLSQIIACSNHAKFDAKKKTIIIESLSLEKGEEIKWNFGLGKDRVLSKGFIIQGQLPSLTSDSVNWLHNKKGADSWLIKISREKVAPSSLGYLYIPLVSKGTRGGPVPSKINKFIAKIYYSAAAPSKRFENFKCPAFNHKKKIKSIGILKDDGLKRKKWFVRQGNTLSSRVRRFNFSPVIFNGGSSLRGSYVYDVALYDSKRKTLLSSFVRASGILKVSREEEKSLSGCESFEIPKRSASY